MLRTRGYYYPVISEAEFDAISDQVREQFRADYPTFSRWQKLTEEWSRQTDLSGCPAKPVKVTFESFAIYMQTSRLDGIAALSDYAHKLGTGEIK
jgi:hypothetical protein